MASRESGRLLPHADCSAPLRWQASGGADDDLRPHRLDHAWGGLQTTALDKGTPAALVFVATVFILHKLIAMWYAKSHIVRHLVRGKPRLLVRDGKVIQEALDAEGVSEEELLAGLRKLGHDDPAALRLATLEETGHISAVAKDS